MGVSAAISLQALGPRGGAFLLADSGKGSLGAAGKAAHRSRRAPVFSLSARADAGRGYTVPAELTSDRRGHFGEEEGGKKGRREGRPTS